eukprot:41674_1
MLHIQHISFIRKVLKRIPVFSRLNEDERRTLSLKMEIKLFKKGSKVVRRNETMKWFGIVWRGQLFVSGTKRYLQPGDWLGEELLVLDGDHTVESTIKCTKDCELFCISQAQFSSLFADRLSYNWRISAANEALYNDTEEDESKMSVDHPHKARRSAKAETFTAVSIADQQQRAKSSYMKSSSLRKWLKVELTKNILLKSLSDEILDAIIDNLYCIDITANTALIRQGEMGTVMYIVEEGSIDVFIDELPVTTMCAG